MVPGVKSFNTVLKYWNTMLEITCNLLYKLLAFNGEDFVSC